MAGTKHKELLVTDEGPLELCFSEHPLDQQVCQRLKVKVGRALNPFALLADAKDWAFAWRGRDDGFLTIARDALLVRTEVDRLKFGRDSLLQWFGGQTFTPEGSAEWGDLRHGLWFLPALTWKIADDESIIILQSFAPREEALRALKARLLELLALPNEPRGPIFTAPKIIDRIDIPGFEGWRSAMEAAKKGFRAETFSKVVLSRSSHLRLDRADTWLFWLQKILSIQEESYIFALKSPDGHCFLGRSPERLLAWKNGAFQVDAIAGTRRRGATAALDQSASRELQLSSKELIEHRYVSQYIANLLKSLDLPFEKIDDEKLLQLKHVQHLRTRFQGQLDAECDAPRLLTHLHPTPAVGGLPTLEAVDFIKKHEAYERGWYAGYIGWCSGASGECAIGIRSALVYQDSIRIFAGAGIVADSDTKAEWDETELKMLNFLQGIEGLDADALRASPGISENRDAAVR